MSVGDRLTAGIRLGPFELVRKLALGGMAEIWSAKDRREDGRVRTVALKVLQPIFSKDKEFRAMFQDEVNIASRLVHENILQIYGAHEHSGLLMQSMELIVGKDLRRILSSLARSGQSFPVPFALLVGREVARALAYAHQKKGDDGRPLEIVHRDISPHNIMVSREGSVKVLDFGIAHAAERLARTRTGVVKGKIAYMAPEQALAVGVTNQTDIFSTGVVVWEMLAMMRLFKANTDAETLDKVVSAKVPSIREINSNVPKEAADLVHRMLEQRAPNRPESMEVVENALTRVLSLHYREGTVTQKGLASWAMTFIEDVKQKTLAMPTPDVADTDKTSTGERESANSTTAVGDFLNEPEGTSPTEQSVRDTDRDGVHIPEGVAVDATIPVQADPTFNQMPEVEQDNMDEAPTLGLAMDATIPDASPEEQQAKTEANTALSAPEVPSSGPIEKPQKFLSTQKVREREPPTVAVTISEPEQPAEKVRMPNKSEIVRAVDAVETDSVEVAPSPIEALPRFGSEEEEPVTESDSELAPTAAVFIEGSGDPVPSPNASPRPGLDEEVFAPKRVALDGVVQVDEAVVIPVADARPPQKSNLPLIAATVLVIAAIVMLLLVLFMTK